MEEVVHIRRGRESVKDRRTRAYRYPNKIEGRPTLCGEPPSIRDESRANAEATLNIASFAKTHPQQAGEAGRRAATYCLACLRELEATL